MHILIEWLRRWRKWSLSDWGLAIFLLVFIFDILALSLDAYLRLNDYMTITSFVDDHQVMKYILIVVQGLGAVALAVHLVLYRRNK